MHAPYPLDVILSDGSRLPVHTDGVTASCHDYPRMPLRDLESALSLAVQTARDETSHGLRIRVRREATHWVVRVDGLYATTATTQAELLCALHTARNVCRRRVEWLDAGRLSIVLVGAVAFAMWAVAGAVL